MAIKIMKKGKIPLAQKMDRFCKYCHCEFECDEEDCSQEFERNRFIYLIECPTCKKQVSVIKRYDQYGY